MVLDIAVVVAHLVADDPEHGHTSFPVGNNQGLLCYSKVMHVTSLYDSVHMKIQPLTNKRLGSF